MSEQVFEPNFSPIPAIIYDQPIEVVITSETEDAEIFYTMSDGDEPNIRYTGPIKVSTTTYLKAIAKKTGYTESNIVIANYNLRITGQSLPPSFEPSPLSSYSEPQYISVKTDTPDAQIVYSFGEDDSFLNQYIGPFLLGASKKIQAKTQKTGLADSEIIQVNYSINPVAAKPSPILLNCFSSWKGAAGGQIELVWQVEDEPTLTSFKIRYGRNPGVYSATVNVPTKYYRAFLIQGLQENTVYYFSVQAVYGSIFGLSSNELFCRTPASPSVLLNETVTEVPALSSVGGVSIAISWQHLGNAAEVHHYKLKIASKIIDEKNQDKIISVASYLIFDAKMPPQDGIRTSFVVNGLLNGIIYFLSITPFLGLDGLIEGKESNQISYIKNAPLEATPSSTGAGTQLSWSQLPLNFTHSCIVENDIHVPANTNDGTVLYSGVSNKFIVEA